MFVGIKSKEKRLAARGSASRCHRFTNDLPASATVETAAMKRRRPMKSTTCHSRAVETAGRTARHKTPSAICAPPARMTIPRTPVPPVRHAPTSQPARTVEPWPSSNEDAAHKPVRTVVAIRSAAVRSVPVVSIRTDRRTNCHADRPHSDSHADLRLRISKRHRHHHRQHRNIFQVTHNHLPLPIRSPLPVQKPFPNPLHV
jgi:hypothetical protein